MNKRPYDCDCGLENVEKMVNTPFSPFENSSDEFVLSLDDASDSRHGFKKRKPLGSESSCHSNEENDDDTYNDESKENKRLYDSDSSSGSFVLSPLKPGFSCDWNEEYYGDTSIDESNEIPIWRFGSGLSSKNSIVIKTLSGIMYQVKLIMLFVIRGYALHHKFNLQTEEKKAGKFDDIVFEYTKNDEKYCIVLQAKCSSNEERKIKEKDLLISDGDFSLSGYYNSYRTIEKRFREHQQKQYIICTNIGVQEEIKSGLFREIGENDEILILTDDKTNLLKLRKENNEKIIHRIKYYDLRRLAQRLANCLSGSKKICFNKKHDDPLKCYFPFIQRYIIDFNNLKHKGKRIYARFNDRFLYGEEHDHLRAELYQAYKFKKEMDQKEFADKFAGKDIELSKAFASECSDKNYKRLYTGFPINGFETQAIEKFLDSLVFAVNQPSGRELDLIIEGEIKNIFKVVNANFVANQLLAKIINWMAEEQGRNFDYDKSKLFFDEACKSLNTNHNRIITEKLDYTFSTYIEIGSFLKLNEQIFYNLVVPKGCSLLGYIKIHQYFLKFPDSLEEYDDFAFVTLDTAHLWWQLKSKNKLLIIECKPDKRNADAKNTTLELLLNGINSGEIKKIIFITEKSSQEHYLLKTLKNDIKFTGKIHEEIDQNYSFADLDSKSKKLLLKEGKIIFQGKEVSLKTLIISKSYYSIIKDGILADLIAKKTIKINEVDTESEVQNNCYIHRTLLNGHTKKYQSEETVSNETSVIILGASGAGKSTLVTHLVKNIACDVWITRINLIDFCKEFNSFSDLVENETIFLCITSGLHTFHSRKMGQSFENLMKIPQNNTEILKSIRVENEKILFNCSEELINCYERFAIELFFRFLENGKVALIIDGFEEIRPYNKNLYPILQDLIKNRTFQRIWITTREYHDVRTHLADVMQQYFSEIHIFQLIPLTNEGTNKLLENYWTSELHNRILGKISNVDKKNVKVFRKTLVKNFSRAINDHTNSFLSTPLHILMVAETFCETFTDLYSRYTSRTKNTINEAISKKIYDLSKLYERFIKFKMKNRLTYLDEKEHNANTIGHSLITNYELLAVHALFPDKVLSELTTSGEKNLFKTLKTKFINGLDKNGIVNRFDKGKPIFEHRSYAEYFVAEFLYKKIIGFCDNEGENCLRCPLVFFSNYETIFSDKFKTIRRIFESKLANDHTCDWSFDDHHEKKVLGILESKYSTSPLAVLADEGLEHFIKFLLKCANNDQEILKKILNKNTVDGIRPIHLAARNGRLQVVKYLYESFADINILDSNGESPLKKASDDNHWKTVEYLLKIGASTKKGGALILARAIRARRSNTVQLLLANGVTIESTFTFIDHPRKISVTPIDLAILRGDVDITKILIERGAKYDPSKVCEIAKKLAANRQKWDTVKFITDKVETNPNINFFPLILAGVFKRVNDTQCSFKNYIISENE